MKALAANPNEIQALNEISQIYQEIGKVSKAYAYVEKIELLDPLNPRYISRGFCYLYDCRFQLALEQFRILYQTNELEKPLITDLIFICARSHRPTR